MRHWAKWPRIFGMGLENHVLLVKIAFFDETPEDKSEVETISVDYIIFSNF
jgi:hypothetical protein